jgi:hypothetical protein
MRGIVLDEESLGMPGASVAVSGGTLAHERYTTTDDLGRFRVRDIPPGEYRVLIVHRSAEPVTVGVVIRAHRTTDVPVTLSVGGNDGAILIVDQEPVLDMTTSSVSTVLDGDTLQDLPVVTSCLWQRRCLASLRSSEPPLPPAVKVHWATPFALTASLLGIPATTRWHRR